MAWALNQIWLGDDPPLEALKATQEQAKEFGWDYRFWTWGSLTSIFGFYYFQNFILSKLPPRALTFLTKFYLWLVLEQYGDHGMFLDATASLPLSSYSPEVHFTLPGVYVASDYSPSFLALSHASAVRIGREAVVEELKLRYKANGDYMFHFFSSVGFNILGSRYLSSTLIPRWKKAGVRVFNNPEAESTSPHHPLPPSYLLPSPFHTLLPSSARKVKEVTPTDSKIPPVDASAPEGCSRILILGESIMGITDVDVYSRFGDLIVHLDSCPFFEYTGKKEDVANAVFYHQAEDLPQSVLDAKEGLYNLHPLIPGLSFNGYAWHEEIRSKISPQVALACSYRERNPFLPIIIYGHNTADDVIHGYDTELESSLLASHDISLIPPRYDLLFLILTREGHYLRRALLTKYWVPKLEGTKHAYRFCHAGGKFNAPLDALWSLPNAGRDDEDEDVGLKVYTALAHARHMRAKYYFLMLDDTFVDPSRLWSHLWLTAPQTLGRRYYDAENEVLVYDLRSGVAFSAEALTKVLDVLTADEVVKLKQRPDLFLAQTIHSSGVLTSNASPSLFSLPEDEGRALPCDGNEVISYAGVSTKELRGG